jgi:glutaredoxin 3
LTAAQAFRARHTLKEKTLAKIEIYTRPGCGYCNHARRLLDSKGLTFTDYDVYQHPHHESTLRSRTHNRSYPQIFINDLSVGGFEELARLDQQNRLPKAASKNLA